MITLEYWEPHPTKHAIEVHTDDGTPWRTLTLTLQDDGLVRLHRSDFEKLYTPTHAIKFLQEAIDWIRAQIEESP